MRVRKARKHFLRNFVGAMDACPLDEISKPYKPKTWHTNAIVTAPRPHLIEQYVAALERSVSIDFKLRFWKNSSWPYRRNFARGLQSTLIDEQWLGLFVAASANREQEIITMVPEMLEYLRIGKEWCEYKVNGQEGGISIGPYPVNGEACNFLLDHRRAIMTLWMAHTSVKLYERFTRDHKLPVYWELTTDLLIHDQPGDPWGVKTLMGIIGSKMRDRIRLRVSTEDSCYDMLADNIAALIDTVLRVKYTMMLPNKYQRAMCASFEEMTQRPNAKDHILIINHGRDQMKPEPGWAPKL